VIDSTNSKAMEDAKRVLVEGLTRLSQTFPVSTENFDEVCQKLQQVGYCH
jgi:hypothetical protein